MRFRGTADIGFMQVSAWMARTEMGTQGHCREAERARSAGVEIHWLVGSKWRA